jgi:hypothetical protein
VTVLHKKYEVIGVKISEPGVVTTGSALGWRLSGQKTSNPDFIVQRLLSRYRSRF